MDASTGMDPSKGANQSMRMTGMASGMDIDDMIDDLMAAERMPLQKMEQDEIELSWKTDAFRDINSKLRDLDEMTSDMKLSGSFNSKSTSSSQESAVTATANSDASEGTHDIEVDQIATGEMRMSEDTIDGEEIVIDVDESFDEDKEFTFYTYDEDGEKNQDENGDDGHTVEVEEGDTLDDVFKKIYDASDGKVQASYDDVSEKVMMETTRTGVYNNDGHEMTVEDSNSKEFFENELGIVADPDSENISEAQDAEFKYNGLETTSRDNEYTANDVTFEFNDETDGNARISVSNDTDEAVDKIKDFVDQYNDVIEDMNESQQEEENRDYPPLTDEQKDQMSDDEIEKWEEKAKSGILRGESSIQNGMLKMRQGMQAQVDTDGEYDMLSQIGITQTDDYLDGGKLEINEDELKEALENNADDVQELFTNRSDDEEKQGIIQRFDEALDQTKSQIESKAGNSHQTPESYSIGREMKRMDERIETFEERMEQVEERYYDQFTQMEQAMQEMNEQSEYMMSQFGGGEGM